MNQFCDCSEDGYCPRYQRNMTGRFREICAGINCDLGTAAAFREDWAREANVYLPQPPPINPIPLLLKTDQAPGDAVVMTAAIYSLHKAHPGKYLTAVESIYPEVFHHNPDVVEPTDNLDWLPIQMHYPAIHKSCERGIHFMQGYCEHLSKTLGISIPLLTNKPHLYFDKYHNEGNFVNNFWIICSGGKNDFTNKLWPWYQEVVDMLRNRITFIQVGTDPQLQPHLKGAHYLVGKTTLRHLFGFVRRAKGVLCGVSLLMHVAAALDKRCVVLAGGREPVQWNAYPKQHYLHTVGELGCYPPTIRSLPQGQGAGSPCWRSRTIPLETGDILDKDTCLYPVGNIPKCMTLIRPETVAELVLRLNQ